jgi:pimeloyl-ACP methyl ester carboxylesterase
MTVIETVACGEDYGRSASPDWRQIDWAAHEHDLSIGGRRVHYVDIGDGPPGDGRLGYVLVHGLGGCWQHWSETLPFLAQRGRAIAPDLPGFGRSELPASAVSLDGFADTVAELARAVGLERVVFIGHSLGGPVALRFASRHPELAHALVLVGGAVDTFSALLGLRNVTRHVRERPRETLASLAEVLTAGLPAPPEALRRLLIERPPLRRLAFSPYLHRPNAIPADTAALILQGAGAPGVIATVRAIGRSDPREGLSDVRCPMLSIGARHDRIVPLADFEAFDRDAPAATSVLIEGCGHMTMLERPRTFNDRIDRFLAGVLSGGEG